MRFALPLSFLLPTTTLATRALLLPFDLPELEDPNLLSNVSAIEEEPQDLRKRDGNCPVNYNSCSTLAAADGGACCTAGSICTLDGSRNIACCPTGAKCTGTIDRPATTTGTGVVVVGSSTTGTITSPTPTATGTLSVVPNAFFPFPIIANSYSNSAACLSAYSACTSNYAVCTADLQGSGGFGVTIVAPAGGVTFAPTATTQSLGLSSATSICSSLSSAACGNIQTSNCAQFETGTGFVVGATSNPARPRQTMGAMATMGVVAGLGLGFAGQLV